MSGPLDVSRMFDLAGRTALVTGCSRGLGLAMAVALASAGVDIVGVSATLAPEGSEAERDAVLRFARIVTAGDRAVDILIDNAGTIERRAAA